MKVIKQYQCDFCGLMYDDIKEAELCELHCDALNKGSQLKEWYRPLGKAQIVYHEAYHIFHNRDSQLLELILIYIVGDKRFDIGVSTSVKESKECVLEVTETNISSKGIEVEINLYTKKEWNDRVSVLLI